MSHAIQFIVIMNYYEIRRYNTNPCSYNVTILYQTFGIAVSQFKSFFFALVNSYINANTKKPKSETINETCPISISISSSCRIVAKRSL